MVGRDVPADDAGGAAEQPGRHGQAVRDPLLQVVGQLRPGRQGVRDPGDPYVHACQPSVPGSADT
ncbi:hypothetical protein Abr02nite_22430 [Paractinoplanes brasiliensis]|nr:hypothetical protein Abr02nite_22430 [Actinoplanes brasiliensis]